MEDETREMTLSYEEQQLILKGLRWLERDAYHNMKCTELGSEEREEWGLKCEAIYNLTRRFE